MHREMGEKRPKKLRVNFLEALEPGSFISKGHSYFFLLTPNPFGRRESVGGWGGEDGGGGGLKALPADPRLLWGAFPVGIELVCS